MNCPIDNTELVMSERQKVEIDYCPKCRGVWLDRGELDKIIERVDAETSQPTGQSQPYYTDQPYQGGHHGDNSGHHGSSDSYNNSRGTRRRGGFLGDIFG